MQTKIVQKVFPVAIAAVLIFCMIGTVSAQSGTITMAYQGNGGYYIGDIVMFTGKDTFSNMTVIKITGPGLPPQGVPPNNLNGTPGSGNTVYTDSSGMWAFLWDTSNIQGGTLLQTARYHLTAIDNNNPDQSATTSVMLERSVYSMAVTPNPAKPEDYVQVIGNAENGIGSVNVAVIDSSGDTLHYFAAPVSASGYFNYGFHVDMPPGQYTVVASNPLKMTQNLNVILTVAVPITQTPAGTTGTSSPTINGTEGIPASTTIPPVTTASRIPTRIPLSPLVAIGGVAGAVILSCLVVRKR
jgi:hypothetical protein